MNRLMLIKCKPLWRAYLSTTTNAKNFEFMVNKGFKVNDTDITLASGVFGYLSESSVMCKVGGSVIHASVNSARSKEPGESGLPLTVDYRSRQYAFGVIPGSRHRREVHGSQDEILVARFVDRAVRPLFPKGYVNEIQITVTSHAADGINDPTVAAVNAASFALLKSKQPWNGPVGCVRVGLIDGQLKVDPTLKEMENSTLDFLYAGTANRTLMIETAANQVPDETIKAAMRLAHNSVQNIITAQLDNVGSDLSLKQIDNQSSNAKTAPLIGGSDAMEVVLEEEVAEVSELTSTAVSTNAKRMPFMVPSDLKFAVMSLGYANALEMYATGGLTKTDRGRNEGKLRGDLLKSLTLDPVYSLEHAVVRQMAVDSVLNSAFRSVLLDSRPRIDGRDLNKLRDISSAVDVMPSVHGSSYFARGDTHVLSTTTLGSKTDAVETLPITGSGEVKQSYFMLHYDFPPYCTGEMGNSTSVNRRMVGHGKLAERAIRPVMPTIEEFPYTVRVYSECTSSNGSSSMASACGASLALMDAGVPLKAPVAGLSVGLITHENLIDMLPALEATRNAYSLIDSVMTSNVETVTTATQLLNELTSSGRKPYVLLKDILGTEDHNGDMDFKIAGTENGVTAIQLDVKLQGGVPLFMLEEALDVANEGRREILKEMSKTLGVPKDELKATAPRAELVRYDSERRTMLYGQGGEMLRYMEKEYDCVIDTTEEDIAYIFGKNPKNVVACRQLIQDVAVLVKEGDVLSAQVTDIKDFGLTVKVNRAQDGILHMSEISHDPDLIKKPLNELFTVGQRFDVQVFHSDKATGTLKVSRKRLLNPETSVPDRIRHEVVDEVSIEPLPTFPVIPPRKFSKDYFAHNVVNPDEITRAMTRYAEDNAVKAPPANHNLVDILDEATTTPPSQSSNVSAKNESLIRTARAEQFNRGSPRNETNNTRVSRSAPVSPTIAENARFIETQRSNAKFGSNQVSPNVSGARTHPFNSTDKSSQSFSSVQQQSRPQGSVTTNTRIVGRNVDSNNSNSNRNSGNLFNELLGQLKTMPLNARQNDSQQINSKLDSSANVSPRVYPMQQSQQQSYQQQSYQQQQSVIPVAGVYNNNSQSGNVRVAEFNAPRAFQGARIISRKDQNVANNNTGSNGSVSSGWNTPRNREQTSEQVSYPKLQQQQQQDGVEVRSRPFDRNSVRPAASPPNRGNVLRDSISRAYNFVNQNDVSTPTRPIGSSTSNVDNMPARVASQREHRVDRSGQFEQNRNGRFSQTQSGQTNGQFDRRNNNVNSNNSSQENITREKRPDAHWKDRQQVNGVPKSSVAATVSSNTNTNANKERVQNSDRDRNSRRHSRDDKTVTNKVGTTHLPKELADSADRLVAELTTALGDEPLNREEGRKSGKTKREKVVSAKKVKGVKKSTASLLVEIATTTAGIKVTNNNEGEITPESTKNVTKKSRTKKVKAKSTDETSAGSDDASTHSNEISHATISSKVKSDVDVSTDNKTDSASKKSKTSEGKKKDKKSKKTAAVEANDSSIDATTEETVTPPVEKRKRGRKPKALTSVSIDSSAEVVESSR